MELEELEVELHISFKTPEGFDYKDREFTKRWLDAWVKEKTKQIKLQIENEITEYHILEKYVLKFDQKPLPKN